MQLSRGIGPRSGHTDLEPPFFYAAHAGLSGVFFFQGIRKKLGNSISFSVGTYHMVAVNDCSVLSSCASHTHRRHKLVSVHLSFHNGHYAVIRMGSRFDNSYGILHQFEKLLQ